MPDEIGTGVRHAFAEEVKEVLFHKTRYRLLQTLIEIVVRNSTYHANYSNSLSFRGKVYSVGKHQKGAPCNLMSPPLRPQMKEYLREVEEVDREEAMAMGYILNVLSCTGRSNDLIALLPNSLHGIVRTFDEHFIAGEGKFSPAAVVAFLTENERYIKILKARMLYNLIEVGV